MIEILLQAERALTVGLIDQAERLYRQAASSDPRNSIAVVGLARVALERGDEPEAWRQARRALAIDPENVAAQRLAGRLEEVWAYQGRSLPEAARGEVARGEAAPAAVDAVAEPLATPEPAPAEPAPTEPAAPPDVVAAPEPTGAPDPAPPHRPSVVDRLLRRNRP